MQLTIKKHGVLVAAVSVFWCVYFWFIYVNTPTKNAANSDSSNKAKRNQFVSKRVGSKKDFR